MKRHGAHAIVLGASVAGLLAARALADRFDRVTLLERDVKPDTPRPRKGVPQGNHVHNLLVRGMEILEDLFPGFSREAQAAGALLVDMASEFLWYQHFGLKLHIPESLRFLLMSRPLLESVLDRRVRALPNVILQDRTVVRSLEIDDGAVCGATLDDGRELSADLVVDATGRGSQVPRWLEALGYPPVPEAQVRIDLGYATRRYRRGYVADGGTAIGNRWRMSAIVPTAPETRGAALFAIENDEWISTLLGWVRDHPPGDEAGYLDFLKSLPCKHHYETVIRSEPCSDIVVHRFPSNYRRYYERASLPRRLLVVGDSVCSFNPGFGQGMTVAAMQVDAAAGALAAGELDTAVSAAQKKIGTIVDIPWDVVVNEDLRHEATVGERTLRTRVIQWYSSGLMHGGNRDPVLASTFLNLANFTCSPNIVFRPTIAARILSHCFH